MTEEKLWVPGDENLPAELATVVPPRPVAGAVISTAWGGDIHDRALTPMGIFCSGASMVGIGSTETKLALNTINYGNAEFLDNVNDQIVIPVGAAGLYIFTSMFQFINTASWVRIRPFKNGAVHIGGCQGWGSGGTTHFTGFTYIAAAAEGDVYDFRASADAADPADVAAIRCGIMRIGNNLSSSLP